MKFSKALEKKFDILESYDYRLLPGWLPGQKFCTGRKLYLRPERDCKHCAWYECPRHPLHFKWPKVKEILASCWTFNPAIPEPGKPGRNKFPKGGIPWDGKTKKLCQRYNKYFKSDAEDPCVTCTLCRPCIHRGELGESLRFQGEVAAKARSRRRRVKRREDDMFYITKVGNRFLVRIQIGGKQTVIGRYDSAEEAKAARNAALLKFDGRPAE